MFNNDYYHSLVTKGWSSEKAVGGNENKNQFQRTDIGRSIDSAHKEMMLTSDMCMMYLANPTLAAWTEENTDITKREAKEDYGVPLLAQDHVCCAWTGLSLLYESGTFVEGDEVEFCGDIFDSLPGENEQRGSCCRSRFIDEDTFGDCDAKNDPQGPATAEILSFVGSEEVWLASYVESWKVATSNGVES